MYSMRVPVAVLPQVSVATYSIVSVATLEVSMIIGSRSDPFTNVCTVRSWPATSLAVAPRSL
jgi:hypothetical protein